MTPMTSTNRSGTPVRVRRSDGAPEEARGRSGYILEEECRLDGTCRILVQLDGDDGGQVRVDDEYVQVLA